MPVKSNFAKKVDDYVVQHAMDKEQYQIAMAKFEKRAMLYNDMDQGMLVAAMAAYRGQYVLYEDVEHACWKLDGENMKIIDDMTEKKEQQRVMSPVYCAERLKTLFNQMFDQALSDDGGYIPYMSMTRLRDVMVVEGPKFLQLDVLPNGIKQALDDAVNMTDPNAERKKSNILAAIFGGTAVAGGAVFAYSLSKKIGILGRLRKEDVTRRKFMFGSLATIGVVGIGVYTLGGHTTDNETVTKIHRTITEAIDAWAAEAVRQETAPLPETKEKQLKDGASSAASAISSGVEAVETAAKSGAEKAGSLFQRITSFLGIN